MFETSTHSPAWEAEYDALAFTLEALRAEAAGGLGGELEPLGRRVAEALADWHAIDAEGRRLRHAALAAEAAVRVADAALDRALGAFAADVLRQARDDRSHALYARFFPAPHEDVVDLGLDTEVPVATLIVRALDEDEDLPGALREHRETLRAALQRGTAALLARPEALAEFGRHHARIAAWLEGAAATQRAVLRGLRAVAEAAGLPPRWLHAFFRADLPAPR